MIPFKVIYSYDPPQLISYDTSDYDPPDVSSLLQHIDKILLIVETQSFESTSPHETLCKLQPNKTLICRRIIGLCQIVTL